MKLSTENGQMKWKLSLFLTGNLQNSRRRLPEYLASLVCPTAETWLSNPLPPQVPSKTSAPRTATNTRPVLLRARRLQTRRQPTCKCACKSTDRHVVTVRTTKLVTNGEECKHTHQQGGKHRACTTKSQIFDNLQSFKLISELICYIILYIIIFNDILPFFLKKLP